ncbi:MAG TPA: DNA glycosylase [Fimbriimonadaceae bacterium]|nr:DNA glycosylase [Fimbriimonadaceae bacterium]
MMREPDTLTRNPLSHERGGYGLGLPPSELDLPLCVSSGQVFRWEELPDGRWLGVDGEHWYLVKLPDSIDWAGEQVLQVQSNASAGAFIHLFRIDWSLEDVERSILDRGPELAPYVEALRGLRTMRPSSAEETLFCFLCTPNNHLARITQMVRKLAAYGEPLAHVEGRMLTVFPTAERIAAIPEDELRAQGFGYRARTIPHVARQLLDRSDGWLESLKATSYEEAHRELIGLKGVGRKLADCIALFGLHHMRSAPVDTHLWQAMCRLYRPDWSGKSLTDARYLEAGDLLRSRFGDLTGWAHQYLFYDNLLNWRERRKLAADSAKAPPASSKPRSKLKA